MKRLRKKLLIGGGLLLLLLVIALAAALNSGVQTAVARHYLQQSDPKAQIGQVSFGFGGGQVTGLVMSLGGGDLKASSATLQYSFWNMIFGHPRVIEDLQVKDFEFDATKPSPAKKTAAETSSAGQKGSASPILVKKATISGKLLLPGQRTAQIALEAHDLGAGSAGQATAQLTFLDPAADAKVREMRAEATLDLACNAAMFPESLNLTANLSAVVTGQAQPARLTARLEAKPQTGDEGSFSFALSEPGTKDLSLLALNGSYGADGSVKGSLSVDATRARLEPFALGYALPDFDLIGSGNLVANPGKSEASAKVKLEGRVGHLGALRADLEQIGSMKFNADMDVAWTDGKFDGRALTASIAPETGNTALSLALLKPVTLDFSGKTVKLINGTGPELLRVTFDNAPAAWLAAFAPAGYTLSGRAITGEIVAGARDDGAIVAQTTKALSASGLQLMRGKNALFGGGYLELDSTVVYQPGETGAKVQAEVRQFLCSAETVDVSGGVLKLSTQQGAIVVAQYAGNVSATFGNGPAELGGAGHLAVAFEIDQADRAALGAELPAIMPTGRLLLDATFDAARGAKSYDVASLQANVTKGQSTVASVKTLQKISIPLSANGTLGLPTASGNVAILTISGLPLALAQPFLGQGVKIGGVADRGEILIVGAATDGAGLDVRTEQTVTINNFHYGVNGTAKLAGVTVTMTPAATWRADDLKSSGHLEVISPAGRLIAGTFELAKSPAQWSANITADGRFGALAAQPFAAEWRDALADPKPEYTLGVHATGTADSLTVDSALARIMPAGGVGAAIGDIHLLQPVKVDIAADGKYGWPKASGDVASIKLFDVPAGVLAMGLPGCALQGRGITGNVVVSGDGAGNYTATSSANSTVSANNLTVTMTSGGKSTPWLRDLTFIMRPTIKFNPTGVTYFDALGIELSSGGEQIGQGDLEMAFAANRPWWSQTKASLKVDLGLLLTQPILSRFNNLDHGTLQLDGETASDGAIHVTAKAASWEVRSPKADIRQFTLTNMTGRIDQDKGGFQLEVPISCQSPIGETDCTVSAMLGPEGPARNFSFSLTGKTLIADDLLGILNAFRPPPESDRPPGASAPESPPPVANMGADTKAFWGALQGHAQVQLQRLEYHGFFLDSPQTSADFTPTLITVPAATARFENAPLNAGGTLAFDARNTAQPYQLQAKIALQDFDTGQYFLKRNPRAKPPVEGKFSIAGAASGRGANLNDLMARVPFSFNLNSSGGVFHVLDLVKNKNATAGAALTIGSGLASIASGLLGQAAPKVGQSLGVFTELVTALDSVSYNSLVLVAKRGDDGTITMSQFEVRNPLVELAGAGAIKYVPGVSIPDQPLTATLQLNATGRPAQILNSVGLLHATNAEGYQQGPQFQVTGSLQSMNYDSLYTLLFRALVGGATNLIR